MPQNNLLGEAGKHRVASELLLRGFHVLLPASDEGVDLFTEEGHGIQVKAAHVCKGNYNFSFRFWTCKAGEKRQVFGRLHPKVTHIILWCVDDDTFLVIPRAAIPNPKHISITKRSLTAGWSKKRKFIGAWELLGDTNTFTAS